MCAGTPRATGSFRFGDGETYEVWRGWLWAMPMTNAPLPNEFFPDGSPGLRRLSSEEMNRVWGLFRAEAKRHADLETGCCRSQAQEVVKILSAVVQKENGK